MLLDSILPRPVSSGNECDKRSLNIAIFLISFINLSYLFPGFEPNLPGQFKDKFSRDLGHMERISSYIIIHRPREVHVYILNYSIEGKRYLIK